MKTLNGKFTWLAALLVAGGLGFNSATVFAQDDKAVSIATDTNAAVATSGTISVEVSVDSSNAVESAANNRWEERAKFRDSFDGSRSSRHKDAIVVFGKDVVVNSNETAEAVVVIGGSAIVHGKVRDGIVAIGGDVKTEGAEVGDAVVAVMGGVNIGKGSIIHGDVVSVGGAADVADDATVSGKIQPVDFGSFGLPKLDWLKQWFVQCVLKLRPLAIGPHLGWLWAVAGVYFLLYLLVAVALPKPVAACVDEMTRRPVTTFFTGLLAKLLVPVVIIVLAATGIGLIVVPFIAAAVFFGVLIGKAALFEYLGRSVGRMFGVQSITPPALALAIGIGIVTLLYLVPVLGLVVLAVLSLWGLGLAVTAGLGGMRKESRPPNGTPPVQPLAAAAPVTAAASMGFAADAPQATAAAPGPQPSAIPVAPHPAIAEALAYPRAGFWERMGAGFLDLILAGILCHLAGPFCLLAALAYFAGMWAWKGTTIGGIVLNLKVVRTDGKPISFVVALVRGLAAAFSMMVLFLGFFWIAWDKERQGWHDKIAGTVVIRVPRGMSLVCL